MYYMEPKLKNKKWGRPIGFQQFTQFVEQQQYMSAMHKMCLF